MSRVTTKEMNERVIRLSQGAYDMFPMKHKADPDATHPFSMYSYERVAMVFWRSFIEELVINGMTDDKVRWLLQSKNMRWMLDAREEKIEELAKKLAKDQYNQQIGE